MEDSVIIYCNNQKLLRKLSKFGVQLGYMSFMFDYEDFYEEVQWCAKHKINYFISHKTYGVNQKLVDLVHQKNMKFGLGKVTNKQQLRLLYRLGADLAMVNHVSLISYNGK